MHIVPTLDQSGLQRGGSNCAKRQKIWIGQHRIEGLHCFYTNIAHSNNCVARNQNRLEVNIPLAVALQITSIWQIWCAVHIVQHMEGSCGLSAKALSHVITLRFNKYSLTLNVVCS